MKTLDHFMDHPSQHVFPGFTSQNGPFTAKSPEEHGSEVAGYPP